MGYRDLSGSQALRLSATFARILGLAVLAASGVARADTVNVIDWDCVRDAISDYTIAWCGRLRQGESDKYPICSDKSATSLKSKLQNALLPYDEEVTVTTPDPSDPSKAVVAGHFFKRHRTVLPYDFREVSWQNVIPNCSVETQLATEYSLTTKLAEQKAQIMKFVRAVMAPKSPSEGGRSPP